MKEPNFNMLRIERRKENRRRVSRIDPCDSSINGCITRKCKQCPMDWETMDELMRDVQEAK